MKPNHDRESGAFETSVRKRPTLQQWMLVLNSITPLIAQSNDHGLITQIKEGHL